MKELEGLDVLIAFLEGAIEHQNHYLNRSDERGVSDEFAEGKLSGLADVLEEAMFIKVSFLKGNSK